jgi:hypothetical protein
MRSPSAARPLRYAGAVAAAIVVLAPRVTLAADPTPTVAPGGDPRSAGQGPGLVGDPLWAVAIVAAIALLTLVACFVYLRATAGGRD